MAPPREPPSPEKTTKCPPARPPPGPPQTTTRPPTTPRRDASLLPSETDTRPAIIHVEQPRPVNAAVRAHLNGIDLLGRLSGNPTNVFGLQAAPREQLAGTDDHSVLRGVDLEHVCARRPGVDAQAAALSDGETVDTGVLAQTGAVGADDLPGVDPAGRTFHEVPCIAGGDETEFV